MNRAIRIGLLAEGEAELGASVPYIKPEDGGKVIERDKEGALHTLIRRELESAGFAGCDFVQRHPSVKESGIYTLRTGHSILDVKYLARLVSVWMPEEVDMIMIVADADDVLAQRQRDLERALNTIRNNHLDANKQEICDRSASGLAIRIFETWLLADIKTVTKILDREIEQFENLEALDGTKNILDSAIAESAYLSEDKSYQRSLRVKWKLAFEVDLAVIKDRCPIGYATFVQDLTAAAKVVANSKEFSQDLQL
jgi:hypothetical protein